MSGEAGLSSTAAEGAAYPPPEHLLRDLRVVFEQEGRERTLFVEVVPEILTDRGALDAGIAATLVDIQSGGAAIEQVTPDWIVTSDMTLHMARPVAGGTLTGRTRLLRAGRNNVVLETGLWEPQRDEPAVLAQLGFTRVTPRTETPRIDRETPVRTTFALPGSGLDAPVYERLGLRSLEPGAGRFELDVADYQRNSVGALQGGVVVALATQSAQGLARAVSAEPVVTTDLTAHYLALGKVGPVRSEATLLRSEGDQLVVRVELRDEGQQGRLCTVVTATAQPFG